MTGSCPASCTDITLLANPATNCVDNIRRKTLSRLFFYPCSLELPDPITNMAIKALFDDGSIVASNKLGNIVWGDPGTEDLMIDECSPSRKVINTRTLTAEDRISVAIDTNSPAITNLFGDYDFWDDKNEQQLMMNSMIAYCDGDVIIPKDRNGNPLAFTMLAYLSWQKAQQQGGAWVEFKKLEFNFMGDPMALYNKPAFNWITAGIVL